MVAWVAVATPSALANFHLMQIEQVIGSSLSIALRNALLLAGGLAMLFTTSLKLTLLTLAGVPLVMIDEIHRIEGHERILGRITIGSMRFDRTITLRAEHDRSGPRTRVGMKLVASNRLAVIGELVPRIEVQRIVIEHVDTTLRQIRKYCESLPQRDAAIA